MTELGIDLLAAGGTELERPNLQARVWEPDAERMLDRIRVRPGARCLDLGCGGMGILAPLSRRAGPAGRVLGLEADPALLAAARSYADREGLENLELLRGDPFDSGLPRESFDLVHARFVLAPLGRNQELAREVVSLARPGGVVALQEPDASSWRCFPEIPAFATLRDAILEAFARGGGDFNAGRRIFGLLQEAGLQNTQVRPALLAFQNGHPYMRLPLFFVDALRDRILEGKILSDVALRRAVSEYESFLRRPGSYMVTFTVMQAWSRKAAR
jgi:SAM-dependent methyltransferase